MRLCLISYEYLPDTGYGGAAALYTDLSKALARAGHEVVVLSGLGSGSTEFSVADNLINMRFGKRTPKHGSLGVIERASSVLMHYRKVANRYGGFDVVEFPDAGAEGLMISALRRESLISTRLITPHFLLSKFNGKRLIRSMDFFERTGARLSDVILADSSSWGKRILQEWKIDESRLRLCPIGIDMNRIDGARSVPIPIEEPYILFAGRLTPSKGPQVLAKVAESIIGNNPDVKIVFAGADTLTSSGLTVQESILESVSSRVRDSMLFLGFVESWDMLVSLYRGASVCVKADVYGNHSFDLMGQMACGRPVICARTEGNEDMICDGQNGLLFDRGNPTELADGIARILGDSSFAARLGEAARTTIEKSYSSSLCAHESIRVYESMI